MSLLWRHRHVLRNVFPCLPISNGSGCALVDPEEPSQTCDWLPGVGPSPKCTNLVVVHLGEAVADSARSLCRPHKSVLSVLRHHIVGVAFLGTRKEMRLSDALPIVASVEGALPGRKGSVDHLPCDAIRPDRLPSDCKLPIAAANQGGCPWPAWALHVWHGWPIELVDLIPEPGVPFLNCFPHSCASDRQECYNQLCRSEAQHGPAIGSTGTRGGCTPAGPLSPDPVYQANGALQ